MPKPNLFVIGAQKSGTTSLHDFLASHPDIYMSEPKEPGFFTPEVGYYPTDRSWYLGLFDDAGSARIIGESSTHYSKRPTFEGVPERIDSAIDQPRFVYLMRDPVDRAISHYWHDVGKLHQHRPILAAIDADSAYVHYSDYAMQLEPYLERFGSDAMFTLTFESLVASPTAVLHELLVWLGVDPEAVPLTLPRSNVRPDDVQQLRGLGLLHRFARSAVWGTVAPLFPKAIRRAGRKLAVGPARVEDDEEKTARKRLRLLLAERTTRLEQLLDRTFPEWPSMADDRHGHDEDVE